MVELTNSSDHRPKQFTERVNVKLTAEQKQAVESLAAAEGAQVGAFVRRLIVNRLEQSGAFDHLTVLKDLLSALGELMVILRSEHLEVSHALLTGTVVNLQKMFKDAESKAAADFAGFRSRQKARAQAESEIGENGRSKE